MGVAFRKTRGLSEPNDLWGWGRKYGSAPFMGNFENHADVTKHCRIKACMQPSILCYQTLWS